MAITQAIANAFKKQLLEGDVNFKSSGGDVFKLALFTSSATLNSTTTAYSSSNEVANTGTYAAGGDPLTGQSATSEPELVKVLHSLTLRIYLLQV